MILSVHVDQATSFQPGSTLSRNLNLLCGHTHVLRYSMSHMFQD